MFGGEEDKDLKFISDHLAMTQRAVLAVVVFYTAVVALVTYLLVA